MANAPLLNDFKGDLYPAGQIREEGEIRCDLSNGIDSHGQIGITGLTVKDGGGILAVGFCVCLPQAVNVVGITTAMRDRICFFCGSFLPLPVFSLPDVFILSENA